MLKKLTASVVTVLAINSVPLSVGDLKDCMNEANTNTKIINEVIEINEVLDNVKSKTEDNDTKDNIVMKVDSEIAYVNNTRSDLTSRNMAMVRNNDRAMISLRFLAESMNAVVKYNFKQNKIVIKYEGIIFTIYIDQNKVLKNGVLVNSNFVMQNIDNNIYVPVRDTSEIFNVSIDYERKENGEYVTIIKNNKVDANTPLPTKISTIDVEETYYGFIKPCSGIDRSYYSDSGIDIHCPIGTPVYAIADCYINFSEYGHTPWKGPNDTAYSIMVTFDKPVNYNGVQLKSAFYTHLSRLVYSGNPGRMIHQGELIGYTGIANNAPHLHFEILQIDTMSQLCELYGTKFGLQWVAGK